jgi:hypothetical protein
MDLICAALSSPGNFFSFFILFLPAVAYAACALHAIDTGMRFLLIVGAGFSRI